MADYRRYFVPGGTYFFTVVTEGRAPLFQHALAREILGNLMRDCQQRWPFEVNAIVLLPEHLHAIWSLPPGDAAYSRRWGWIKKEFTEAWLASGGAEQPMTVSRQQRNERGIWQRRYWEHTIEDEGDFERHFDYVHYNPVKHQHVPCPRDWPSSSFHRRVERGVYDLNWGCRSSGVLTFDDLNQTAMELEYGGLCPPYKDYDCDSPHESGGLTYSVRNKRSRTGSPCGFLERAMNCQSIGILKRPSVVGTAHPPQAPINH